MNDTSENSDKDKISKPQLSLKILNEKIEKILEDLVDFEQRTINDVHTQRSLMKSLSRLEKVGAIYVKNRFAGALTVKTDLWLDAVLKDLATNTLVGKILSLERDNENLILQLKLLQDAESSIGQISE